MQLELDHVFVCVQPQAPEAKVFKTFGLVGGKSRIHHGQGTANHCFFFQNAYIELLWLHDNQEIQSPNVRPLGLWERCNWRQTQACPFGISWRLATPDLKNLPFPTWDYYAPYLPPGASIPIVTKEDNLWEPLVFISRFAQKPSNYLLERQHSLTDHLQLRQITGLRIILPNNQSLSEELTMVIDLGLLEFSRGQDYHLEIEFDHGYKGQLKYFDSILPISIKW